MLHVPSVEGVFLIIHFVEITCKAIKSDKRHRLFLEQAGNFIFLSYVFDFLLNVKQVITDNSL